MNRLERLLEKLMYKDRVQVRRAVHKPIGKTDDYTTEYEVVYEEVGCKISQYGVKSTGHRDDVSMEMTENYRVNVSPEYEVRENDLLDVLHMGQRFKLYVTKAYRYPTHQELDCKRRTRG